MRALSTDGLLLESSRPVVGVCGVCWGRCTALNGGPDTGWIAAAHVGCQPWAAVSRPSRCGPWVGRCRRTPRHGGDRVCRYNRSGGFARAQALLRRRRSPSQGRIRAQECGRQDGCRTGARRRSPTHCLCALAQARVLCALCMALSGARTLGAAHLRPRAHRPLQPALPWLSCGPHGAPRHELDAGEQRSARRLGARLPRVVPERRRADPLERWRALARGRHQRGASHRLFPCAPVHQRHAGAWHGGRSGLGQHGWLARHFCPAPRHPLARSKRQFGRGSIRSGGDLCHRSPHGPGHRALSALGARQPVPGVGRHVLLSHPVLWPRRALSRRRRAGAAHRPVAGVHSLGAARAQFTRRPAGAQIRRLASARARRRGGRCRWRACVLPGRRRHLRRRGYAACTEITEFHRGASVGPVGMVRYW